MTEVMPFLFQQPLSGGCVYHLHCQICLVSSRLGRPFFKGNLK